MTVVLPRQLQTPLTDYHSVLLHPLLISDPLPLPLSVTVSTAHTTTPDQVRSGQIIASIGGSSDSNGRKRKNKPFSVSRFHVLF